MSCSSNIIEIVCKIEELKNLRDVAWANYLEAYEFKLTTYKCIGKLAMDVKPEHWKAYNEAGKIVDETWNLSVAANAKWKAAWNDYVDSVISDYIGVNNEKG